jgi:hypothetical protein
MSQWMEVGWAISRTSGFKYGSSSSGKGQAAAQADDPQSVLQVTTPPEGKG